VQDPPIDDEARCLLAEYASDLLSVHDAQGRYLYASPSSERLFGWKPAELVGLDAYELFHPEDVPLIREDHEGHAEDVPGRVRYRLRCKDDEYRWVETRSLAHREPDGALRIMCITRDVHDEEVQRERARAAETAMLRASMSQRLIGLVRGLAHEINNPLSAAFLTLAYVPELPPEMEQALRRIRDVVRELGLLAELAPGPPEPLSLPAVVERVLALTDETRRGLIVSSMDEVTVRADRARLYQLVYVLVVAHAPADTEVHSVQLSCRSAHEGGVLEIVSKPGQVRETIRADLGAAIRGEAPAPVLPLQLAEQLTHELGGRFEMRAEHVALTTTVELPAE